MSKSAGPKIEDYIARWTGAFVSPPDISPWKLVQTLPSVLEGHIAHLGDDYVIADHIAIHKTATIESGAIIKGPAVVGPGCYIAGTAYLRGGVFLGDQCTIGPGSELKTTVMCSGSKLAHLNFVGDSLLGNDVNIEAGAIIANYRNEMKDKEIKLVWRGATLATGCMKFGALVGDGARIGANAVIAPGAILERGDIIPRLGLVDQWPS